MYIQPEHIDGLMQDCSISIVAALEILQSCTKPSNFIMAISNYQFQIILLNLQMCLRLKHSSFGVNNLHADDLAPSRQIIRHCTGLCRTDNMYCYSKVNFTYLR